MSTPMASYMTRLAKRNNIEPIFRGIAFMVVVFFGCFMAVRTLKSLGMGQIAVSDCFFNSIHSFSLLWVVLTMLACSYPCKTFAVSTLVIMLFSIFAFIAFVVVFTRTTMSSFPFFRFAVFDFDISGYFFASFCFSVSVTIIQMAAFTITFITITASWVLVKFRNRFGFLANSAGFCYDLLRHDFFLSKKLCLEPLQTQYLCGSLHYTTSWGTVNA